MSRLVEKKGRPLAALILARYRVRRCLSMHDCVLCDAGIKLGQDYHDGGDGRRAHVECVKGALPARKESE